MISKVLVENERYYTPLGNDDHIMTDTSTTGFAIPNMEQIGKIEVQVGERRFIMTRDMLMQGSGYFASRLSGPWSSVEADGSYFVDRDPDMFVHVLRYLRSLTPPIFYDKNRGHDYSLYTALLVEAQFFQIPELVEWIGKQEYLGRVLTHRKVSMVDRVEALEGCTDASEDVEYHSVWKTEKIYLCPRRIYVHEGRPERCGRMCQKAQGVAASEYEEIPVLKVLAVRKSTVLV